MSAAGRFDCRAGSAPTPISKYSGFSVSLTWRFFAVLALMSTVAGQSCDGPVLLPLEAELESTQVAGSKPENPPWLELDDTSSVDDASGSDTGLVSEDAGSTVVSEKAAWIRQASDALGERFSGIDGFMWFNFNKERDWRVNSSAESLAAFWEGWGGLSQGVFLPDFPGADGSDVTPIEVYEAMVGTAQTRIGWHVSLSLPFPATAVETVQRHGATPCIVWEPYDADVPGEGADVGESRLDDIVGGVYDGQISAWARDAAANGDVIEITFGHEANGDWYTWGYLGGHNGNTPELYAAAYRHVRDIFDAAGASHVRWVWTINASWRDDFSSAFPGIEYVDQLAINGFNFGGDSSGGAAGWESWREFEQIFGCPAADSVCFNSYQALAELADLPIIIGEFASGEWVSSEQVSE